MSTQRIKDQTMPSTPLQNTAAMREMLGTMKATIGTLGQTLQTFNEQSAKVASLGPSPQETAAEIQLLQKQIRSQEKRQDLRVRDVKHMIKNMLKDQVAEELRAHIQEQIRAEVCAQVRVQMDAQILDHLPATMPQLQSECKKSIVEVKHALLNSEARRANAILRTDNLDDVLAVVLKPDGTKSELYPVDLRSLFSYDVPMTRALLKDHGLVPQDHRERNLNLFMVHIGIQFRLVTVPASGSAADNMT